MIPHALETESAIATRLSQCAISSDPTTEVSIMPFVYFCAQRGAMVHKQVIEVALRELYAKHVAFEELWKCPLNPEMHT